MKTTETHFNIIVGFWNPYVLKPYTSIEEAKEAALTHI